VSREFFARVPTAETTDPSWVIQGLGSRVRILRVEDDGVCPDDNSPCSKVFHTGPEDALCVVSRAGFVHPEDRPSACPSCHADLGKDPFPVWCRACDADVYTPVRPWEN